MTGGMVGEEENEEENKKEKKEKEVEEKKKKKRKKMERKRERDCIHGLLLLKENMKSITEPTPPPAKQRRKLKRH